MLGFDNLDGYLHRSPYFGAIVGRYGNRIAHAAFTLDGIVYKLDANDRGNVLHGGRRGFGKMLWTVENTGANSIDLTLLSKDGDEGFPGNLSVHVRYTLTDANELKIDYSATTDKPAPCLISPTIPISISPGREAGTVLRSRTDYRRRSNHTRQFRGRSQPEPIRQKSKAHALRFPHAATRMGERINADDPQLKFGGGYDLNWVLNKKPGLRAGRHGV